MSERFVRYMERLGRLSNEELERSVGRLVASENRNVACVIAHLTEIGERRLPLELGYRSLFEYAVGRLGLSEGSVYLRLQVAGVCRRLPEVLEAIAGNRVSLTVAGKLAPHLNEENVERLLSECAGKTKRETEEYLVGLAPKPVVEPRIRKRPARVSTTGSTTGSATAPAIAAGSAPALATGSTPAPATGRASAWGDAAAPGSSASGPVVPAPALATSRATAAGVVEPARPEVFNFRFAAERGFREKLERLGEVLGIDRVESRMAEVLEFALDCALDRKDPARRLERRRERERRAAERRAADGGSDERQGEEAEVEQGDDRQRGHEGGGKHAAPSRPRPDEPRACAFRHVPVACATASSSAPGTAASTRGQTDGGARRGQGFPSSTPTRGRCSGVMMSGDSRSTAPGTTS